ncbi:putative HTH-type transcriptional regulator/MT2039 [Pseudoruegeria aquimaris]|uniref:Putative HTH-type transcriptional regulator/MT2039 n=1 Tax=Pseudoruegeria aquimaris TaxID=393663 RepID=A0A1Y5RWT6_9RHOB|nr:LysR family transcriptional regulator ArgP [Pseudoruegeria aquimaris]SLN27115.1 putative HTH-type transcriptional regulator/MT2039 [Pseudoruegeria aquimaris]
MFADAHLEALRAVVRTGSFEAAAAALGITPSAVSQRIKALEERIGTVLVRRGHPCEATAAGARLCRHGEAVALLERALAEDLGKPAERAQLRIAVNADSLATWFLPAMAEAEGLLFDIVVDDQDHSADWLRRGEVMAAVTAHGTAVQGCDSRPLGALRYIATASPGFAARHFPEGITAQALAQAPGMTYTTRDALQKRWVQQELGREAPFPTHFLPSTQAFVDGALLGLGWGMNPEALVAEHIRTGRLVALGTRPVLDVALHWQVNRLVREPLAPLTRAVRASAARWLHAGSA